MEEWSRISGLDNAPSPATPTPAKDSIEAKAARILRFKRDVGSTTIRQRLAVDAYERATGVILRRPMLPRERYPGLLDQMYAAGERSFRFRQCRRQRRQQQARAKRKGRRCIKYAVTLARTDWIVPSLDRDLLRRIRKQVQRQAKRLSLDWVVTGIVDICPMDDRKTGVKGWSFHVHLTVQLIAKNYKVGKKAIQKAFPYPSDDLGGVPNAKDIREAYDVRGWDHYQDKLLQWGGVRQRVVRFDSKNDKRKDAHHPPLTHRQEAEWAVFISQITADDVMIWVGHRRYKNKVLPMGV